MLSGSFGNFHIERSKVLLVRKANRSRIPLKCLSVYGGSMMTSICGSICHISEVKANISRKQHNLIILWRNKSFMMSHEEEEELGIYFCHPINYVTVVLEH